ncbi:MAG: 1-(5-phosphoribosyl)-5-[(5-phosphoribosylamino)methylideneamino]imidazole-4-carboxamide isomerase [Candidatus Omnitrophica bacterium]|nr:1-(5-phosphoribosyl)-5-[(5-phosphoribosylamino)methylideneamino]imidazole-4-carboxamide isomerase [Candidatus Omnitrophota bacterium]
MKIYPAIDLYKGKVVRLTRGQFDQETVYSADPISIAREWEEQGAEWLHIVDLEGAKDGVLKNLDVVLAIRKAVRCHLQLGGGLRSLKDIQQVLAHGIDRAVIGTKALDENFLEKIFAQYGHQIAIGLDVRDNIVQTQGWLNTSGKTIDQMLTLMKNLPIKTLIYTNIKKDGMLAGPDFKGLTKILEQTSAQVILSGGVGSLSDIEQCKEITQKNFEGVIIGKALYDKKFSLREVFQVIDRQRKV